jgi:nitrite reductase/ring-hydroxylating ferredoxin subunit
MLAYYTHLYGGLYDEDVSMMAGRQSALDAAPARQRQLSFGALETVRVRLPILFELGGKRFRLVSYENELIAHAATCPHMLGPLDTAEIIDGAVKCPWHGYVFDVKTGLARTGEACKLAAPPSISIDAAGEVIAAFE